MRRLEGHGGCALRDGGRAMEGSFVSWGEGRGKVGKEGRGGEGRGRGGGGGGGGGSRWSRWRCRVLRRRRRCDGCSNAG